MKLTGLFEAIPLSMSQSRLDAYIFADLKLGYIKCAFFAPGSDLWKQLETPTEVMLLGPHEPRRYTKPSLHSDVTSTLWNAECLLSSGSRSTMKRFHLRQT